MTRLVSVEAASRSSRAFTSPFTFTTTATSVLATRSSAFAVARAPRVAWVVAVRIAQRARVAAPRAVDAARIEAGAFATFVALEEAARRVTHAVGHVRVRMFVDVTRVHVRERRRIAREREEQEGHRATHRAGR